MKIITKRTLPFIQPKADYRKQDNFLLWPWPWPHDLNIWTWPRYSTDQKWTFHIKAFKI